MYKVSLVCPDSTTCFEYVKYVNISKDNVKMIIADEFSKDEYYHYTISQVTKIIIEFQKD